MQRSDTGLSHSLCPFVGAFVLWRLQPAEVHAPELCKSITKKKKKQKMWGESTSPICSVRSVPTSHQTWAGWGDPTPAGTRRAAACCVATGWISSWHGQDFLRFQRVYKRLMVERFLWWPLSLPLRDHPDLWSAAGWQMLLLLAWLPRAQEFRWGSLDDGWEACCLAAI